MRIARILFPVYNLGPGKRMVIWVAGCSKGCFHCANPELQDATRYPGVAIDVIDLMIQKILQKEGDVFSGVTITGGEPMEQPWELATLLELLSGYTQDILVFSGYKREELPKTLGRSLWNKIEQNIAVLIDGEYREQENTGHPLKGSSNQRIHFLKKEYEEVYNSYIQEKKGKKEVQMFRIHDGRIAVGIHEKDFQKDYQTCIERKRYEHI